MRQSQNITTNLSPSASTFKKTEKDTEKNKSAEINPLNLFNQVPDLAHYNLYLDHPLLAEYTEYLFEKNTEKKNAIMIGMGMTEKQGGSDVRTIQTIATRHGTSAYGNQSNASCGVEFHNAYGILVGEIGRGIATIIEMANHTRLDCVIGSSALMRQAVVQSIYYANKRIAFAKPLINQPLMRNVLCDMVIESEAATILMLHLADAFEKNSEDKTDLTEDAVVSNNLSNNNLANNNLIARAYKRIVTPAAKFWICKRALALSRRGHGSLEWQWVCGRKPYAKTLS
ncbi:hypothetical protein ACTFIZ_012904 [Dictyostelium cf. discoideum]